jgi:hypothetical protein
MAFSPPPGRAGTAGFQKVAREKKLASCARDLEVPLQPSERLTHLNFGAYDLRLALRLRTPPGGRPQILMSPFLGVNRAEVTYG